VVKKHQEHPKKGSKGSKIRLRTVKNEVKTGKEKA
jgi:hypothetical protein